MKCKNFILFIMFIFILVGVLLVSCGPKKKYAPVASVMRQRKVGMPFKKPPFGFEPKGLTDSAAIYAPAAAPAVPVAPGPTAPAAVEDPYAPQDPADVEATAAVNAFFSYFKGPNDNETPEESMQKEKEIGEIKGKISVEVKEILKKHFLARTDVGENVIIPEFDGHFVIKPITVFVGKEIQVVDRKYNLGVLSTLFWDFSINWGVESKYLAIGNFELQKEFYLALEYNDDLLKPFAYVYGKLSHDIANGSSYDEHTKDEIIEKKIYIVENLRDYAKAYYIDLYQSLLDTEDKLNDKLSLEGVRFLKSNLDEIELAKQELRTDIIQRFVNDVKKYEPYSIDSKHDVWPHLRDTFNDDFQTKCDAVINPALEMKDLLDSIQ
ncbi:virulence associated lipoprotein [Borrelia hispanica]|uniref:virulence associated lipoprotein n=1 Tax=Borrelia hispanica TaxID=40835 RepID=UPI0004642A71|nr:virulence associated lipoprotein [Borrelia hispanica]